MTEEAWMTFMPDGTDDDVWYTNPEGKLPEGYTYQKLNPNWSKEMAQTEQEPVQFKCTVIDDVHPNGIPLEQWTPPPQRTWVGLTNEEIFETHKQVDSMQYLTFGKAIEAKLKEKNT